VENHFILSINESSPDDKKRKSVWARFIKKIYGVDPLLCPKCGSGMKILVVILDPDEIKKILIHLVKIDQVPPNFDPASLK